jgi:hypothetical protein
MSFGGRGRGRGGRGGRPVESGGLLLLRRSAEECGLDSRNIRSLGELAGRSTLFPDIEIQYSSSPAAGGDTPTAAKRHSAQTIYLIAKSREIHHRITNSVFYVRPTKDVPDVLRYSDLTRSHDKKRKRLLSVTVDGTPRLNNEANIVLSHCLGGKQETDMGRFVPEELVTLGQQKALNRRALSSAAAAFNTSFTAVDTPIDDTAAWEENFGPDDDNDDDILNKAETARQRSDSTGSAVNNNEKTAAGDELDELSAEEEEEEEEVEDYVTNYYESGPEDGDDDGDDEPTF